ncbi:uncharacterized protein [Henckelia pumila]|uniref:uncharacterized protein n=1 Tax=Henckelia pumila TaxID=405737 RepID=UPI003C6E136E
MLNHPSGFNTQRGEGMPSLEYLVRTFITESSKRMDQSESRIDNIETHFTTMRSTMKSLEVHIGQLENTMNNQQRNAFPSNTEVNPKEQCKAITLRCGKEISSGETVTEVEKEQVLEPEIHEEIPKERHTTQNDKPAPLKVSLPYPHHFKKKALDEQFSKFLEIFKKIHIKISFANALEQMPHYAKFIKDVMTRKRKELELGELKPTMITLQLEDRYLTYPHGIVEEVLVKVDNFIFPAKFFVLDIEEDQDVPLILGRPFLDTR